MTTAPIDPNIRADVLRMARNGAGIRQIGNETGLLDKEIRLIIDAEKRRLAENPTTAPARNQLPPTRRAPQPVAEVPRAAAQPDPATFEVFQRPPHTPPRAQDGLAALIDQAEASDIGKVRTAARRAVTAIDQLREVMDATETERREKAAAKAQAEREAAQAAEKNRAAQARVDQLARDLEAARAELAAVTPGKKSGRGGAGKKRNLSPETREKMRQNALRTAELKRQKRAALEAQQAGGR